MWSFILIMGAVLGCGEKDAVTDTAEPVIVTPSLSEDNECGGENVTGIPLGNIDCINGRCTVEAGQFWMGSDFADAECPIHQPVLSAFQIDQYEVTLEDWQRCVSQGRCSQLPAHCTGPLYNRPDFTNQFPAICVTWQQASNYCQGAGGRLPTEAEWEKAAAGTDGAKWAWGSLAPECADANFRLASIYCSPGVRPVGWYTDSVSPYGLYDVNGNVFEWTADWFDAEYYMNSPELDPVKDAGLCVNSSGGEPTECTNRVLRGGAYNTTEATIRNASRSFAKPDLVDVNVGFRCAYDMQ